MLNLPEFANEILSKEEASELLRPHFADIRQSMDEAWQEWLATPNRHKLDNRARAANMHCFIVHNALEKFLKKHGAKPVRTGNSFWLYIDEHIKARFKKLDDNKRYRNYPTATQLQLAFQGNIPGILPGTYLTLGYQLDKLEQSIAHHLVTLQIGKKVIYEIDIDAELGAAGTSVVPMPAPIQPAPPARRVRPRRGVKEAAAMEQKAKGNAVGGE